MSRPRFEAFLAELYTDDDACRRFLADPCGSARRAGLDSVEIEALVAIDRRGLELASHSFALKRARRSGRRSWWRRWLARCGAPRFLDTRRTMALCVRSPERGREVTS